jgi:hypothetical protein
MSRRAPFEPTASMLAVTDGRLLCGYFLHRRDGTEAFTADGESLGVFPSQDAATDALYQRGTS